MNASSPIASSSPSVVAQVANLANLPMGDLKVLWRRLFGNEPPTHVRKFLERRIAYKLQEIEFRRDNHGRALLERNQRRIATLIQTGTIKQRDRDYRPMPGTVLTREYQGIEHRVVVGADGDYEFEGRRYPSLSMIAREITGTRWSGPLFFGLKAPAKPKAKADKKSGGRR